MRTIARNYAALPHEYLDEMAELTDEEFGHLVRGLLRYSMTGEVIQPFGNTKFYVRRVMMQEDRFQASYNDVAERLSEAGKRGAAKRWGKQEPGLPMAPNGLDGNTKSNQSKSNHTTLPRSTERRNAAAGAASVERMKKDMAAMEQFTKGGGSL